MAEEQAYWCKPCREVTDWVKDGEGRGSMYRCTGRDGKCTNKSRMEIDVDMKSTKWLPERRQAEIHRRKMRLHMREKRKNDNHL